MGRSDAGHRDRRTTRAGRIATAALGVLLACAPLAGQQASDGSSGPDPRRATIVIGLGSAFGWMGGQVDYYLLGGRVSVFGGAGYTPDVDKGPDDYPSGLAGAGGVRAYTAGVNHRAFLEASYSQIALTAAPDKARRYGPGLQFGYQWVTHGGFTLLASGGAGMWRWEPTAGSGETEVDAILNLGVGYTWR